MQGQNANNESHSARPLVIQVFIPNVGCSHRCCFCNQAAVTGQRADLPSPGALKKVPSAGALKNQIDHFLSHSARERHPIEIAFYGGSFLGLDPKTVRGLLEEAARYVASGKVGGLRFSTRPDTVNQKAIDLLRAYPITTVEIGAQSMVDEVLRRARRGHSAADTGRAMNLLHREGYRTGLQLMVGLPSESREDVETTGRAVVDLAPDFVRIYPTIVLAESALAIQFQTGRFKPIELSEAVWRTKTLYRLFHAFGIGVVRMGLQASADLELPDQVLAGPYHPAFGHLVYSALFLDAVCAAIESNPDVPDHIELTIHPNSESKLRGLRNQNMDYLSTRFTPVSLTINTDTALSEMQVGYNGQIIDGLK